MLTEDDQDYLETPQSKLASGGVRQVSSRIELLEKVAELMKLHTAEELNLLKSVLVPQLINELIKRNELPQLKELISQTVSVF